MPTQLQKMLVAKRGSACLLAAAAVSLVTTLLLLLGLNASAVNAGQGAWQEHARAEESAVLQFVGSAGGGVHAVAISGTLAFAGEGAALIVLDVSAPAMPLRLARLPVADIVHAIVVRGRLAYLALEDAGLQIVEVGDPAEPRLRGAVDTPGTATGLVVSGGRAYISDGEAGLQIVDVSDPEEPALLGQYSIPGFSWRVQLAGTYALMMDAGQGLYVLDVRRPAQPALAAYHSNLRATDMVVQDGLAYLVGNEQQLSIYDVTQPLNPTLLGRWDAVPSAQYVTVAGDMAYVTSHGAVQAVDVSDPQQPTGIAAVLNQTGIVEVAVGDGVLYAADSKRGVRIVDVASLPDSEALALYRTPFLPTTVGVLGDFAFVADRGLHVIDISDPSAPVVAASVPLTQTDGLDLENGLAYVAAADDGLFIYDIASPPTPTPLGHWQGMAAQVTVQGDLAYVGGGGELIILDVSSPLTPTLRNRIHTGASPAGFVLGDGHVYASDAWGFQVVDVRDPDRPLLAGRYTLPVEVIGQLEGIAFLDGVVYLTIHDAATFEWLMLAVDAGNPAAPHLARIYDGYAGKLFVQGDYLFVSGGGAELEKLYLLEASDAGLLPRASKRLPVSVERLALSGDQLFVADGRGGLQILQLNRERFFTLFLPLLR